MHRYQVSLIDDVSCTSVNLMTLLHNHYEQTISKIYPVGSIVNILGTNIYQSLFFVVDHIYDLSTVSISCALIGVSIYSVSTSVINDMIKNPRGIPSCSLKNIIFIIFIIMCLSPFFVQGVDASSDKDITRTSKTTSNILNGLQFGAVAIASAAASDWYKRGTFCPEKNSNLFYFLFNK